MPTKNNPILSSISQWMQRNFSDPGAVSLFFTLLFGFLFIEYFGRFFLPVIISIVLAYLLLSVVRMIEGWKCPHLLAVIIVYVIFLGLFIYAILGLIPSLLKQSTNLIQELPYAFTQSQAWVTDVMHRYPKIFSATMIHHVSTFFKDQVSVIGKHVFQFSIATISNVIQVVLYFVLVPLLVFFFLKDSQQITEWLGHFMPKERGLVLHVWSEVNEKIGCYIRGRIWEIIIIAILSTIVFAILGLQYAVLLGSLVGLAVIVPYIGAIVVTIPVVIVALMEWGLVAHFLYFIIAYIAILIFDANFLVPILFSETMDLHPVVIILSVVIFGGLWGFWGVFFAIPLATLVNSVLHAWPTSGVAIKKK